jgi:hypothetical protein
VSENKFIRRYCYHSLHNGNITSFRAHSFSVCFIIHVGFAATVGIENVRKRTKIVLVGDRKSLRRHVAKPTYRRHIVFDENAIGIEKRITSIELNKPIYVGVAILDLAKAEIYKFHYERMMPLYGPERLRLCLTDTDSFIYLIFTNDVYSDMLEHIDWFDTSDYPVDDPLFSMTNHKVLGKMKDEKAGYFIRQFVGLRSKVYSIVGTCKDLRRAKGVVRRTVQNTLRHEDYMAVLFGPAEITVPQRQIRSKRHHVASIEQSKLALSPIDNKRYCLPNGVETLAWGSDDIPIADLLYDLVGKVEGDLDRSAQTVSVF